MSMVLRVVLEKGRNGGYLYTFLDLASLHTNPSHRHSLRTRGEINMMTMEMSPAGPIEPCGLSVVGRWMIRAHPLAELQAYGVCWPHANTGDNFPLVKSLSIQARLDGGRVHGGGPSPNWMGSPLLFSWQQA